MCFEGPARTASHEMWCTTATTTTITTSTMLMRPPTCFEGLAHDMWCTTATTTTFVGVPRSLAAKNGYVRTMHFWQIAAGVKYNMMPCANVGSKPWYRCECTDDTPCRLGDANSMTFLPWFVPRTEPSVKLREVGPDRGHPLTERCNDVRVYVCRCRTGDEDCCRCIAWEAAAKVSLPVLRYLCSIEGIAPACIAAAPGVAAARAAAAAAAAAAAGVSAARGGGDPHEFIRPRPRWSRMV